MCSEIKRLKELSECKHINSTDRKAIKWALERLSPEEKPKVDEVKEDAIIFIPLNTGMHGVTKSDVEKYKGFYPNIDVMKELRAMSAWSEANKQKRKTKSGIERFINSWLSRAQDQGGSDIQSQAPMPQKSLIERANSGELYEPTQAYYLRGGKKWNCAADYYANKPPLEE